MPSQKSCMCNRGEDKFNFDNLLANRTLIYRDYIEKLFNKPLNDFRKFCIWKIFVPYFVNVMRVLHVKTGWRAQISCSMNDGQALTMRNILFDYLRNIMLLDKMVQLL
jgi:hypothetical protein